MGKAKAKAKKRGGSKKMISLLGLAGMLPGVTYSLAGSTWQDKARRLTLAYTGYDSDVGKWQVANMTRGAFPLMIAMVARKMLNKFGAGHLFRGIPIVGL